jgi:hypothetical protein
LSAREFAEWQAYFAIEPFGEDMADLRAGIVAATIANVNRDAKKRSQPYEPLDFMPHARLDEKRRQLAKPQSAKEVRKAIRDAAASTKAQSRGSGRPRNTRSS